MSRSDKYGGENMKPFTLRLYPSLIDRAKDKAGIVPLSTVIRLLIEKWVNGEITIEQTKK